jgi:transcription elongation GreA/GreB family factor
MMRLFLFITHSMIVKQKVYKASIAILEEKIAFSNSLLKELAQGAENASKSSAGDKHETGRAMVQLEQEKIGNQLLELEAMYNELQKLENQNKTVTITKGSLIDTSSGIFYLSIGLGKVMVDNEIIFALSAQSPFGKQLVGLKKGDVVMFNGKESKINRID